MRYLHVITLFPEMFASPLGASIPKRAQDKGLVHIVLWKRIIAGPLGVITMILCCLLHVGFLWLLGSDRSHSLRPHSEHRPYSVPSTPSRDQHALRLDPSGGKKDAPLLCAMMSTRNGESNSSFVTVL